MRAVKRPQKTRFKRNKRTVCQPVSGHRMVFERPCFSAASLPLLPALVVHSFQLVRPQKCQMPNQRPSLGQVVLPPHSALVLWGFCEDAERVPGLGVPGVTAVSSALSDCHYRLFTQVPLGTTAPTGSSPRPFSCQLKPGDSPFSLISPHPQFFLPLAILN